MEPDLREIIEKNILDQIREDEGIGHTSSGSGHLSHISISLDEFEVKNSKSTSYDYIIQVSYSKVIETEFTYYPDNPPHVYNYQQSFYVDSTGFLVGFAKKIMTGSNVDLDLFLQDEIEDIE